MGVKKKSTFFWSCMDLYKAMLHSATDKEEAAREMEEHLKKFCRKDFFEEGDYILSPSDSKEVKCLKAIIKKVFFQRN